MTTATPIVWEQDMPILPHWLSAIVLIRGDERRLSLARVPEQSEYWRLYRGDGNDGLIIGPTDIDGAKRFAAEWLAKQNGAA